MIVGLAEVLDPQEMTQEIRRMNAEGLGRSGMRERLKELGAGEGILGIMMALVTGIIEMTKDFMEEAMWGLWEERTKGFREEITKVLVEELKEAFQEEMALDFQVEITEAPLEGIIEALKEKKEGSLVEMISHFRIEEGLARVFLEGIKGFLGMDILIFFKVTLEQTTKDKAEIIPVFKLEEEFLTMLKEVEVEGGFLVEIAQIL